MAQRQLTRKHVDKAKEKSEWDFGNKVLYDLCRKYPFHKNVDQVVGKMWLIGRAYATAIERRKLVNEDNDTFYTKVVGPAIMGPDLDKLLNSLNKIRFPTLDNLDQILTVHYNLMSKITEITGMEKRSLVSKYLHFHRPKLFFIYDSRALSSIRKLTEPPRKNFVMNEDIDFEYAKFCIRCIQLRDEIWGKYRTRLSPRQLDNLLLAIAE